MAVARRREDFNPLRTPGVTVPVVTLGADTSPWLIALPAAIGGAAAIAGGYLASWQQLKALREDRREELAERDRDRQLEDLRKLTDLTESAAIAYVKTNLALSGHITVTPAEVLDQLTASTHVYATTARVGDDELAELVENWMAGLIRYSKNANDPGDVGGAGIKAVHDRIGQLMRRATKDD